MEVDVKVKMKMLELQENVGIDDDNDIDGRSDSLGRYKFWRLRLCRISFL